MIPLLPRWNLRPNRPSFYDTDSATLLELASTLHAAMNGLIEEYNNFFENANKTIEDFSTQTAENQEQFSVALRQEFQDFINIVDLKINKLIADQVAFAEKSINDAIKNGQITIVQDYNEETESLEMTVTGGV